MSHILWTFYSDGLIRFFVLLYEMGLLLAIKCETLKWFLETKKDAWGLIYLVEVFIEAFIENYLLFCSS